MTFLLAQQPPFSDLSSAEVLFFKIMALLVVPLWVIYLIKEIFFAHRGDPRVDALVSSVATLTTTVATITATMQGMERRQGELIAQQREDTRNLSDSVRSLSQGVDTILREHEGDIQRLTAQFPK